MKNINEEYYGKSPELTKISKLLDQLIEKYHANPEGFNPMKTKENEAIQKLFCKMFGFKSFWLYWIPGMMRNGYTYLNSMMFGGSYYAAMHRRKNSGFYDRSHRVTIAVYIGNGLLAEDCGMTGDELTAIILHEIGHNFDVSTYSALNYIIEISEKDEKLIEQAQGDTIKPISWDVQNTMNQQAGIDKLRYDDPEYNQVRQDREKRWLKWCLDSGGVLKNFAYILINTLTFGMSIIAVPFIQLELMQNKQMEIFADSFAASYGYGPELATSLEKFGEYDKLKRELGVRKRSKPAEALSDFNSAILEIINGFMEPHGTNIERAKDCIKKLQRDVEEMNYPPEMRAEIMNEIERLQKQVDIMIYGDPNKKKTMKNRVRIVCEKVFGSRFGIIWKLMRRRQA